LCGIAGYAGSRLAAPMILGCLERLEYRGYDSCGLTVVVGDHLETERRTGRVSALRLPADGAGRASHIGVGHTRWATHGRATVANAHPLLSCDGRIAVVHNGVIENSPQLRIELEAQGHRFSSETDSEIIPHLLEQAERDGGTFDTGFASLPDRLVGSFSILCARAGSDELHLVRRGSPLVIGMGDGEYFPSSDIPSFLPLTRTVAYVAEDDPLAVSARGIRRIGRNGASTYPMLPTATLSVDAESGSKGDFDHFMIKEILEQTTQLDRFLSAPPDVSDVVAGHLAKSDRIQLVGAGTSYHACLFGERLLAKLARRESRAIISSEFEFHASFAGPTTTLLAISQSGETADTLQAANLARAQGARVVAMTNSETSSLSRLADVNWPLEAGLELSVAATKSYTAQLARFLWLAHAMAHRPEDARRDLWRARDALFHLTSESARRHIRALAAEIADAPAVYLLGRDLQYVTALEGALKLKEVGGLHAEAFVSGEMKHGPLALVREGTPVILLYDEDGVAKAELAARELCSRGARIYSIGPRPLAVSRDHVRAADALLGTPIAQVVPLQTLAYEVARVRELDPDHPRNLAKAVTVL
jgi:glucosamine--fructose-6-phosphate aminotransferase (isomerizing)